MWNICQIWSNWQTPRSPFCWAPCSTVVTVSVLLRACRPGCNSAYLGQFANISTQRSIDSIAKVKDSHIILRFQGKGPCFFVPTIIGLVLLGKSSPETMVFLPWFLWGCPVSIFPTWTWPARPCHRLQQRRYSGPRTWALPRRRGLGHPTGRGWGPM